MAQPTAAQHAVYSNFEEPLLTVFEHHKQLRKFWGKYGALFKAHWEGLDTSERKTLLLTNCAHLAISRRNPVSASDGRTRMDRYIN